jgi:hypothetical protein
VWYKNKMNSTEVGCSTPEKLCPASQYCAKLLRQVRATNGESERLKASSAAMKKDLSSVQLISEERLDVIDWAHEDPTIDEEAMARFEEAETGNADVVHPSQDEVTKANNRTNVRLRDARVTQGELNAWLVQRRIPLIEKVTDAMIRSNKEDLQIIEQFDMANSRTTCITGVQPGLSSDGLSQMECGALSLTEEQRQLSAAPLVIE